MSILLCPCQCWAPESWGVCSCTSLTRVSVWPCAPQKTLLASNSGNANNYWALIMCQALSWKRFNIIIISIILYYCIQLKLLLYIYFRLILSTESTILVPTLPQNRGRVGGVKDLARLAELWSCYQLLICAAHPGGLWSSWVLCWCGSDSLSVWGVLSDNCPLPLIGGSLDVLGEYFQSSIGVRASLEGGWVSLGISLFGGILGYFHSLLIFLS